MNDTTQKKGLEKLELKVPPVLLVLICMGLMWMATLYEQADLKLVYTSYLAILFCLAGLAVIVTGVIQFRLHDTTVNPTKPNETKQIVSNGIYGLTRNPMYLGMLWILTGWFFYLGLWFNLLFVIGFVVYMNRFQIAPEELMLSKIFGDEYREYQQRVRRWL